MTVTLSSLSPLSGSPDSIKREPVSSNDTMQPPTITVPSSTAAPAAKSASKPKSRKRVNTAEKRHQHNAIERQRRETLNGKFLSLARLLPSLAASRRPSKSAIVNGSIAHLTYQRDQRLLAAKLLRRLAAEHDSLRKEVNDWRKASGYPAHDLSSPTWTDEMEEVCSVEKEVFGNFASFGDGDCDDDDEDMVADPALEAANNIAANFSHGLITPRHSTELDAMSHVQAMFGNTMMPMQTDTKRAATVNGFNWTHEFGFSGQVNAHAGSSSSNAGSLSASISSATSSLPFGAFMSDNISSSGSPSTSTQGGHVLTPPGLAEQLLFDHTPSPGSSSIAAHSEGAEKATPVAWNNDNIVMLQQLHQAQLRQQQQQQQASLAAAAAQVHAYTARGDVAMATSMFNAMFPAGQSPPPLPNMQQQQQHSPASATTPDAFTQSLLASVFPQQGVSAEQIEAWRKVALSGMPQQQQQPAGLRNIGRSHTVPGLGSSGLWDSRVEGF